MQAVSEGETLLTMREESTSLDLFMKSADIFLIYGLTPVNLLIMTGYSHFLAAKRAHRWLNYSQLTIHTFRLLVVGLSHQLDSGWINNYSLSFWLDCAVLCWIYFLQILTGNQIKKSTIHIMDHPVSRERVKFCVLLHKLASWFYFFYLILREKIRNVELFPNFDAFRLAVFGVFGAIAMIFTLRHYGGRRLLSMATGQLHIDWRKECFTQSHKIQLQPSKIRKEILTGKKKYTLYNNIVINLESFKFEHKHKPVLERYHGQNVYLNFEGKYNSIIGTHLHSAHALTLLKSAAIGKLTHPVENKFPKRTFTDFERYETMTLVDRQMIGDDIYLLTFSSNNFYYFMSTNPDLLCTTFSLYYGMNHTHTLESFPICNRLVSFRLSTKQNNPKLAQFGSFRYCSRNKQTSAFMQYSNTSSVIKESSDKTASADMGVDTNSSVKAKCLELYRTKTSKDFEMNYTKTQELSGSRFPWHHGEVYTIIKRREGECMQNYLTYIDNCSTYTAEGIFNIGRFSFTQAWI